MRERGINRGSTQQLTACTALFAKRHKGSDPSTAGRLARLLTRAALKSRRNEI